MEAQHVDKFGVLPNDWLIRKVGDLCRVGTGGTPNTRFPEYYEPATINWIKSGDVKGLYIGSAEHKISDAGMKNSAATPHPRGTVLMAMSGRGKTRGTTAILKIEAACSQSVAAIIPGGEVSSEFVHFQFVKRYPEIRGITGDDDRSGLNMSLIRDIDLIVPPVVEQRKIAAVLGLVQRAIQQQERLIALTAELKKALLHKLFTEGLHSEPQKQTEIGPMPESWDVATLENTSLAVDYGTSVKCEHGKAGFPVLRIPNVVGGSIDLGDLKHGQPKRTKLDALRLRDGDLLFVRTNGVLENAGRCALYRGELEDCYFASYLIRVRVDSSKVLPAFLNEYARTERGRSFLSGRAIRTADGKFNINSGTLKRVLLPLPGLDEQKEIVRQLDLVERKLKLHESKRSALSDLFRTLLHQLMTAQIRVHDLDLPELEICLKG